MPPVFLHGRGSAPSTADRRQAPPSSPHAGALSTHLFARSVSTSSIGRSTTYQQTGLPGRHRLSSFSLPLLVQANDALSQDCSLHYDLQPRQCLWEYPGQGNGEWALGMGSEVCSCASAQSHPSWPFAKMIACKGIFSPPHMKDFLSPSMAGDEEREMGKKGSQSAFDCVI